MNTKNIKETLQTGTHSVVFTKKDGTLRTMKCTLDESCGCEKPKETTEPKVVKAVNNDVVNVWDTAANGWRCFRLDSVKTFNDVEVHHDVETPDTGT